MSIKLLGISGSLRRQSCNTGLLRAAQRQLPPGVTLEIADLPVVPFYNADLQTKLRRPVKFCGFKQLSYGTESQTNRLIV